MQLRLGYELIYSFPQPTPMILALNIHYSRASDIIIPDFLTTDPAVSIGGYRDGFGNWCTRLVAPAGRVRIKTDALIRDSGQPDKVVAGAQQHPIQDLPEETLVFLLGSRYCDTDLLSQAAWDLFGQSPLQGWARVQAVCDFVNKRIKFDYNQARATRTAFEGFNEQTGVCRDFAHLAITLCRCLNIPARYCTGYISDIGTPKPWSVGDFAAWFEVYLGGAWHLFDPRNNEPRIGRVLIARGRDASDVAIATTFGPNILESFQVWTHDEAESASPLSATAGQFRP